MALFSVRDLSFAYPDADRRALENVSVDIERGEYLCVCGKSGCGKTTLLRQLKSVLSPHGKRSGSVLLDGEPVFENPSVKARMLCIPDEPYFTSTSTTRDLMKFTRALYPRFDTERYEKPREIFALDDTRPIRRLSRGMQKQSAFWIALAARPEVLVLDEPVDGLDPVMRRQVWSLIMQDVAERGTTVLVSSHNLRELEDVCDHVGIMNKGKVLLERSLSELQENTVKMQIVFRGEGAPELPAGLNLLHESHLGRVFTIIFRGNTQQITERLAALDPVYMEAVPLTLEEIFIYELGGADYAVRDIVL